MPSSVSLRIVSLQVGQPQSVHDSGPREWITGFYKTPVNGPVAVGKTNLAGDGQADLKVHGGAEKAINVYPAEHYPFWRELLRLDPFPFGAFGENLTTEGGNENSLCVGDTFTSNGPQPIVLQISQPRQPCWKLSRRWGIKDLSAQVERNGKTGWYFRVLQEGQLQAGDLLDLTHRPHPEWTVALANTVMHHRKDDPEIAARLASCPVLSLSWQTSLNRRAAGMATDSSARLRNPR